MDQATAFWGSSPQSATNGATVARSLLRVVDCGLCGVIFVAPYFFGGRHEFGRLVFVSLVAVTAVAWFARQAMLPVARWPRTAAYAVLLLAAALVAIQIVSLPADWLAHLAPRTGQLLPLWTASGDNGLSLGTWRTLSLVPHETTKALAMLLSYCLLFLVVVGRIDDKADVARLLNWLGASATLMAAFGLLQYFTSDGRFFWFYQHPHRSATQSLAGPFINRNHFADFLVMGIGPLASWWLLAAKDSNASAARHFSSARPKQLITAWVLAAATALVVLTVLLSRSRGGVLALLVAGAVLVTIYLRRGLVDTRFMYGLIGLAIVVVGLLSLHGYDQVVERLDDFAEGSIDNIDHDGLRRKIWTANVAAIEAGWLTGAGVGSHSEICPVYLPQSFTKEYTHAENGYLQIATEAGLGGVLLLFVGIGSILAWCVRCFCLTTDSDGVRLLGATAAGLAASAVHSVVDFVWYIPACMSVVVVLAGCALRLFQMSRSADDRAACRRVLPRGRWLELTAAAVLVGAWTVHTYIGPGVAAVYWDRYLRVWVSNRELSRQQMATLYSARDDSEANNQGALNDVMLRELTQVVRWDPQFADAHLRLMAKCVAEFDIEQQHAENAMSLTQIHDAVDHSSFASNAELQAWLQRAVGDNLKWLRRAADEARLAAELCPLHGEAYVYLAQLSFLSGVDSTAATEYIAQGLRVRPHDASVLFEVGRQELAAGNLDAALQRWQPCFGDSGPHQRKIVSLLAGRIPASRFVTTFQPDWPTLRDVWNCYRDAGQPESLESLLSYTAEKSQQIANKKIGVPPAYVWYWQSQMYADVGQTENVLASLQHAYECDPRHYFIRYALAKAFFATGRFAEAEPHYRWCLARHPADKALGQALVTISKARYAQREVATETARPKPRSAGNELVAPARSSSVPR